MQDMILTLLTIFLIEGLLVSSSLTRGWTFGLKRNSLVGASHAYRIFLTLCWMEKRNILLIMHLLIWQLIFLVNSF